MKRRLLALVVLTMLALLATSGATAWGGGSAGSKGSTASAQRGGGDQGNRGEKWDKGDKGDKGKSDKRSQSCSRGAVSSAGAITTGNGRAKISFTVASGCPSVQLSLASYTAPGPTWDASKADQQRIFDSVTQTFNAGSYELSVAMPGCYFQIDFVYGEAIKQGAPFYGDRLIRALNGGTTACSGSAGTTPPPAQTTCPTRNMVTPTTPITLAAGRASISFRVAEGCSLELSLVSYTAPGPRWDAGTADQQRAFDWVTQTFNSGSYQLSVAMPNCYYQVDFVTGKPILQGAPFYGERLIRALNGGTAPCSTSTTTTSPPPAQGNQNQNQAPAAVPAPSITLVKLEREGTTGGFVRGPITVTAGQTVYYQMVVQNTGSTAVTVNLRDDGCDAGTLAPVGAQAVQPGASITFTCSHRVVAADGTQYVNTAVATATNAGPTTASATANVVAQIAAGGVAGVRTTLRPAAKAKAVKVKKVVKRAKPARRVIRAADFTG